MVLIVDLHEFLFVGQDGIPFTVCPWLIREWWDGQITAKLVSVLR
jgi:hypothetical protein